MRLSRSHSFRITIMALETILIFIPACFALNM
ncbi:MAG TPA: lysine transporter LysE, partial [Agrobacterium sp.]|nr:lysine transporter LysE [Agrobacterium sp.]